MRAPTLAALLVPTILFSIGTTCAAGGPGPTDAPPKIGTSVSSTAANAGSASADNIELKNGATTVRIKHIEIAGSALSNADVAALFAVADAKALEARLRGLDAATIVIPEISADFTVGTAEGHLVQKQVLLADVRGGRASAGSAAATSFLLKEKDNTDMTTVGASTFKNLDLAQIVHLATGPRPELNGALHPVCDDFVANAIAIGGRPNAEQPLTIAFVHGTNLKAKPLHSSNPTDSRDGPDAASLNDLAASMAADLVEARDLGVSGPSAGSSDGLKSLALKHAALHYLDGGKIARFELNGLVSEGNEKQPGKLRLASAEINNVTFQGRAIPSVDRIDLRDFAIEVPGGKPDEHLALAVAHAGYEAPGLVVGKLPQKATLTIEHVTFDVPAASSAAPILLAMGYKHLDLSSESTSRYDAGEHTLALDRLSVTGVGMGTLDLKLALSNVSEGVVSQNDTVQKTAAAAMRVNTFDVTLRNDGLIDKAIGFKAAIDGVTVEQERLNITQLVDTGLVALGLQTSTKAQAIVAAVHKFVADPKTLHLGIASKTGLGIEAIQQVNDPGALLDTLDVEAAGD